MATVASKQLENLAVRLEEIAEEVRRMAADEPSVQVPRGNGEWTESDVRWLKAEAAHLREALGLFAHLSENPDQEVTLGEAAEAMGLDNHVVASELGRVSKIAADKWGQKRWPAEAWQDSRDGKMRYRMHPVIAEWWKKV